MPNWTKQAIDEYLVQSGVTEGIIFRSINKGGRIAGRMTEQAIYNMVVQYAQNLGFAKVAPHDLRRTSKMAHKGGAGISSVGAITSSCKPNSPRLSLIFVPSVRITVTLPDSVYDQRFSRTAADHSFDLSL